MKIWTTTAILVLAAVPAHAVTYEQGDFNPADWQLLTLRDVGSADITVTMENSFNGNPGSFWQHTFVNPESSGPGSTSTIQANINTQFSYDPGTHGALVGMAFSYDTRGISSTFGSTAGFTRPAIMQDGIVYQVLSTDLTVTVGGWQTFQWSFSDKSDWGQLLPDGTFSGAQPDFSTDGGVITFGYRYGLGTNCSGSFGCNRSVSFSGIDNYRVELTSAVPEPASFAALAAGLLLLSARLRAKTR